MIKGELRREVIRTDDALWEADDWLGGRQILWMFYQSVKADPIFGNIYHVKKFEDLTFNGDDDKALRKYLDKWDDHMVKIPKEHIPFGPLLE